MKKGKSILVLGAVLFSVTALLGAEQLSRIGVIDLKRVTESYPDQSRVFRALDALIAEYHSKLSEYTRSIDEKDLEILEAKAAEDEIEITRLETMRQDLVDDRRAYNEIKTREINAKRQQITEGAGIAEDIRKAIEYVAIEQGCSAVFDMENSGLWYFSQEIDLTDLVINRLRVISQ